MTYHNIFPKDVYRINDKEAIIHLIKSIETQRMRAFLFFNNKIYIDINHVVIFDNMNISPLDKESYMKYRFSRLKSNINTNNKISFGHVLEGNVAVIDSYTNLNCTNKIVLQSLLQMNFNVVYYSVTSNVDILVINRLY